ncbi:MAG TPA: hypothetical protein VLB09_07490 [Nitrospiria bacterium]|nr:hypothetical protein [Nitrospiria bacterium]
MKDNFRIIVAVFFLVLGSAEVHAASQAVLHPEDRLVKTGEEVMLRVRLMSGGLGFLQRPVSGERVEFFLGERILGQALTDGNGWGVRRFKPSEEGTITVGVQLPETARFKAAPVDLILSVIPPSTPLLLVHLSTTRTPSLPPAVPFSPAPVPEPMEGAVEDLEALSEDFQLVYLETGSENLTPRFREWVFGQGFPDAPLFVWPAPGPPEAAKGIIKDRIGGLKEAGWINFEAGVTRAAPIAEALKELNIKSVMMVEEDQDAEEIPEGVKTVTAWKNLSAFLRGR